MTKRLETAFHEITGLEHELRQFLCTFCIGPANLDLTGMIAQLTTNMKVDVFPGAGRSLANLLVEVSKVKEKTRKVS
jgi:hypothetical protein